MPKDNEDFQIILGGANHEIDVNTLILTLSHLNTIVEETNKELSKGSRSVDLKIRATEKGSFVVDLSIHARDIFTEVKNLFNDDAVAYLANLITTVGGFYGFVHFLKGKRIGELKKGEDRRKSIEVTNFEGDIQVFKKEVVNIYLENPKIPPALANTMKALDGDNAVDSFEFDSEHQSAFIEREMFSTLAKDEKISSTNSHTIDLAQKIVKIVSPDFEFNRRWICYFEGEKRSFTIETDQLKEAVERGLKFGIGDSLIVDLRVLKEWSIQYDTFVNKSYAIIAFHKYIPKQDQSKLDL